MADCLYILTTLVPSTAARGAWMSKELYLPLAADLLDDLFLTRLCLGPQDAGAEPKLEPALEARLSASQKQTLHCNRALLLLLAGRMDACKQVVQQLTKR